MSVKTKDTGSQEQLASFPPAPWTWRNEPYENVNPYIYLQAGKGFFTEIDNGASGFGISGIFNEATARLITAAPDLLEALEGYIQAVDEMGMAMLDGINVQGAASALSGWAHRANAAIAKARGSEAKPLPSDGSEEAR